jgi:hypothetical protein
LTDGPTHRLSAVGQALALVPKLQRLPNDAADLLERLEVPKASKLCEECTAMQDNGSCDGGTQTGA